MPQNPLNFVPESAEQQTYFGFRIVINGAVPFKQTWVVYPNHPESFKGRENGQTEVHMSAETNELVQASPNRKDVKMSVAPAAAAAA